MFAATGAVRVLRRFNPIGAAKLQHQDHEDLQVGHAVGEHDGPRVPQKSVDEPETDSRTEEREHQPGKRVPPGTPGANYLRQKGDSRQRARTVTDHLGLI
jgi:hypothetical protein